MKLPRFSLRALIILIALISLPIIWTAYQLNWIRERHRFLAEKQAGTVGMVDHVGVERIECPWSLRLFGEPRCDALQVAQQDEAEAQSLFPEAQIYTPP